MADFPVRTADQLPALLQAFRKQAGLTQGEAALRLGVTQQTYSALERNAETVGAARLLKLLNLLGVEWVLRPVDAGAPSAAVPDPSTPDW
jgi:HTH-type transcriptional regulator/antitoxin HipB